MIENGSSAEFPGYEKMFAYVCQNCGHGVGIGEVEKNDHSVN